MSLINVDFLGGYVWGFLIGILAEKLFRGK